MLLKASILLLLVPILLPGQKIERVRVVFYNVENLFDTRNDSLTADDDFTPKGRQHWSRERYTRKLLHLSKALIGVGEVE